MGLEAILAGGGKHAAMRRILKAMRVDIGKFAPDDLTNLMYTYTFCLQQILTDGTEDE